MKVSPSNSTQSQNPPDASPVVGQFAGMKVEVGAAEPAHRSRAEREPSGLRRFFKNLSDRLTQLPANAAAGGTTRELPPLSADLRPKAGTLAEAASDPALAARLRELARPHGPSAERAIQFLEMTSRVPELKHPHSVGHFVDALRADFFTDDAALSLPVNVAESAVRRTSAELTTALHAIKDRALDPQVCLDELLSDLADLLEPLRASQVSQFAPVLEPELQAQFR